ncbi:MAG: gamma-glutamylcyclotransferase [Propionibacterium sp.]
MKLRMFVDGQATTGGSMNQILLDSGAVLVAKTQTAPKYRFYSVRDEFPGLYYVGDGGFAVPGELYEMTYELLRDVQLPDEPSELELCLIEMADGSASLCMRMRDEALSLPGVKDISDQGGWHAYLEKAGLPLT